MRELNTREKNLGVIVVLVVTGGIGLSVDRNLKRRTDVLEANVIASQGRLEQAKTLLNTPSAPAPVTVTAPPVSATQETLPSLTLLRDLTLPPESSSIKVIGMERIADSSFRITLQGKFPEMMRFLSYLERRDSRFRVGGAELSKIKQGDVPQAGPSASIRETGSEPAREVRGVFRVSFRS